jgi:hypothetical protein
MFFPQKRKIIHLLLEVFITYSGRLRIKKSSSCLPPSPTGSKLYSMRGTNLFAFAFGGNPIEKICIYFQIRVVIVVLALSLKENSNLDIPKRS